MRVEIVHLLSMEEVPKAVKEIHLHSYQNSAINVEPNIQLNLQNSVVNVDFEGWFCEHVVQGKSKRTPFAMAAWKPILYRLIRTCAKVL